MKVLVAIHDVTPAHEDAVRQLWSMCAQRGVRPALLVVPNWHGAWPLENARDFVQWLSDRARDGGEVFLHGERHDEAGLPRAWPDEIRAFGRTDREGEFLTLDGREAELRIERGVRLLRRLGLSPIGFVAPAWLSRRETMGAIARNALAVSEDTRAIYLHRRGTRLESPVVRWSARAEWRARASAAVASWFGWVHRRHWLVRIALHPRDLDHPITTQSIERTLDYWVARRIPWSYAAL